MQSDDLGLVATLLDEANQVERADLWLSLPVSLRSAAAAIERLVAERDEARASWQEAVTMYQSEAERVDPAISALLAAKEALRPLAVLEVPAFRPKGNAGFYSIRFDDIARARQALKDAP